MLRSQIVHLVCGVLLPLLLTACSSQTKPVVLQPVGPTPETTGSAEDAGYLVVYSAWSNFVDQGSTAHHSRYTIQSNDDKVSREIINHVDRFDEGPLHLPLKPGLYHIRARSARFGRVEVPVMIQQRKTTYVFLDGARHTELRAAQQANAVKLPDGEIVGWSGTVANAPH